MEVLVITISAMIFLLMCLIYVATSCYLYSKYKVCKTDGVKSKYAYWGSAWFNFIVIGTFILGTAAVYVNAIGGFTLPLNF